MIIDNLPVTRPLFRALSNTVSVSAITCSIAILSFGNLARRLLKYWKYQVASRRLREKRAGGGAKGANMRVQCVISATDS